jgi:hypothetical protein
VSVASATRHIGWLLQVNRRLGPEEALRTGRTFARAFPTDAGRPLAPSQITRWESGELPPTRATIRRYEHLLSLAPGTLVAVADAAMRTAADGAALRTGRRAGQDFDRDRLFRLLDRVTAADPLTGADWCALTELIASRPQFELYPPGLWRDISDRLLDEMVDTVGGEWLQRKEAMVRLLRHPAARRYAVADCIAQAGDPTAPSVIEPISLLDSTPDPIANRFVLDQLDSPDSERALEGALHAAMRKLSQGHFRPQESARLVASVTALMGDPATGGAVLPLAVEIGRQLAQQPALVAPISRRLPASPVARQVWTGRRLADPTVAQVASARIAALTCGHLADEMHSADPMLAALVEEALFLPDPDLNLVVTMLIGATPYRIPFARALLDEVRADLVRRRGTYPLAGALRVLTRLRVDIHRPLIHDLLTRRGHSARTRQAAAWATPFCSGRFPERTWRQIFAAQLEAWRRNPVAIGESILHGVTFGIGTEGHRGLLTHIRDHTQAPHIARSTAASWLMRTRGTA